MNELDRLFEVIRGFGKQKDTALPEKERVYENTYLIAGLGNPGREFHGTRHNIGFALVDKIAMEMNIDFSRTQAKALVTDGSYNDNKIILVKPQTYMNKSGHAIHSLLKFYKLQTDNLLLVYDDVDLPFGTMRMKPSGGSAGHKGVQSTIDQLGTEEFPRLRLGVGRPPGNKEASNYVLKPFSKKEAEFLDPFLVRACEAALAFTSKGIDYAMTHFNRNDS